MLRLARHALALVLALGLGATAARVSAGCPLDGEPETAVASVALDSHAPGEACLDPGCAGERAEPGHEDHGGGCTDCRDGCARCPCCASAPGALRAAKGLDAPDAPRLGGRGEVIAARGLRHADDVFQPPRG